MYAEEPSHQQRLHYIIIMCRKCLETLYLGGGYSMHDLVRIIALHLKKTYTE